MARTPASKLSVPCRLMSYWQHWRKENGLVPQVSHDALFAFTLLTADQRCCVIEAYHAWRDGQPIETPQVTAPPGVVGFVGPLGSGTFPFAKGGA